MAGRTAVLAVKIITDSKDGVRGLDEMDNAAGKAGGRIGGKLKAGAALGIGALVALGRSATDSASELQQSTGAVQSIFGRYAGAVIRNARAAADAVGLSQSSYQTLAVSVGSQLRNLGTPIDKVAGQTSGLISKAADLAATFGGSTSDAVEAIGSLMRGEADPIERYGVSINQAAIQAYILSHNLANTTEAQKKNAKRTAIMALLYKQTAAATGQFKRETTSAAGAQEIANAKLENARAALGTRLLPVVAKFKTLLGATAGWIAKNSTVVFTLAGILGGAAVAVLSVNAAAKAVTATMRAFAAVQTLVNLVMNANPAVRIALIIAALGTALVVAYQKSETFRAIVQAAFTAVKAAVEPVVRFFVDTVPAAFQAIVRGLHSAWDRAVGFLKTWGPRALLVLAPFIGIPLLIFRHFGQIVGWLRSTWSTVAGGVRSFVSGTISAVTGIPGKIAGAAGRMIRAGADFIGGLFRGISQGIEGIGSFVSDVAHTVVNGIIRGINAALDLPWNLKLHIPIPFAPDINFGPVTLLPSIPLWGASPAARPYSPDVRDLAPGFPLLGAGGMTLPAWSFASPSLGDAALAATVIDRRTFRVTFSGLVTDPEAVAAQLRQVARRSDERNGLTRGRTN